MIHRMIIASLLSFILFSCKTPVPKKTLPLMQEDLSIESAKNWLEEGKLQDRMGFNWSLALKTHLPDSSALIVIPRDSCSQNQSSNRFSHLWIFRDKSGRPEAKIIEYIFTDDKGFTVMDFCGILIVRDMDSSFRSGFVYEYGKIEGWVWSVDDPAPKRLSGKAKVCSEYFYYKIPENDWWSFTLVASGKRVCYLKGKKSFAYKKNRKEFGHRKDGSGGGLIPELRQLMNYYKGPPEKPFDLN